MSNENIASVGNRYIVTAIKLADWENVAIGDNTTGRVICHISNELDFEDAKKLADKIVGHLNDC